MRRSRRLSLGLSYRLNHNVLPNHGKPQTIGRMNLSVPHRRGNQEIPAPRHRQKAGNSPPNLPSRPMHRVVVLGASGSGKSTLARQIAAHLAGPCIELDAIHWRPNWTATPSEKLLQIVDPLTAQRRWTIDGNYTTLRQITWHRADTLVWLDYPLRTPLLRCFSRTIKRCWTQEPLWSNNRERFWTQFLSRDSLFLWLLSSWRKQRRDYPKLLRAQQQLGKQVIRLRSPAQTTSWLSRLTAQD